MFFVSSWLISLFVGVAHYDMNDSSEKVWGRFPTCPRACGPLCGRPICRGQVGNLPHAFSLFQGVVKDDMNDSSENVGQDGILSHAFSSFLRVATRHEDSCGKCSATCRGCAAPAMDEWRISATSAGCATLAADFHYIGASQRDMKAHAENQPRRNEGNEKGTGRIFVLFVSSWLIFIVSHASLIGT